MSSAGEHGPGKPVSRGALFFWAYDSSLTASVTPRMRVRCLCAPTGTISCDLPRDPLVSRSVCALSRSSCHQLDISEYVNPSWESQYLKAAFVTGRSLSLSSVWVMQMRVLQ